MKTFATLLALLLLNHFVLHAQEQATVETEPAATRPAGNKTVIQDKPEIPAATRPVPIAYRGFFVELSRAENKPSLLSLRQPNDHQRDLRNVYRDERTNRPKGFVLFAIEF